MAGGTGALGQAVVAELLASGYGCTVTWVVEEERRRAEQEFGDRVMLVHADLLDAAGASEAVAAVDELEAVVNLVGGFATGGLVHETEPAGFERMLELNLKPAFNLARAGMPRMMDRGEGAFVGVSAQSVLRPFPGAAGYITAKAAVLAFIRALDAEYKSPRDPLQRDPAKRDRYAGESRRDAGRRLLEVGPARRDREGRPLSRLERLEPDDRRRDSRLVARRAVVREREPPDLFGHAGVLQRAERRADQRDPARGVAARQPLHEVLDQPPVEAVHAAVRNRLLTIAWASRLPTPSSAARASAGVS